MQSPQSGPPTARGLYDPRFEHDACGVGMVADLHGRKSHEGQDNSHKRKRLLLTRSGGAFSTTPIEPNTWLWSPEATKFSVVAAVRAARLAKVSVPAPALTSCTTLSPALKVSAPMPWLAPLASFTLNVPLAPLKVSVPAKVEGVLPRLPAAPLPTCSVPPLIVVAPV